MNRTRAPHYQAQDTLREIGRYCEDWRYVLRLTQQQVAERAGIARTSLIKLEAGESTSADTLVRVFCALGIEHRVIEAVNPLNTDIGVARAHQLIRRGGEPQ